jgi:hypothetical protein
MIGSSVDARRNEEALLYPPTSDQSWLISTKTVVTHGGPGAACGIWVKLVTSNTSTKEEPEPNVSCGQDWEDGRCHLSGGGERTL